MTFYPFDIKQKYAKLFKFSKKDQRYNRKNLGSHHAYGYYSYLTLCGIQQ